MKIEHIFFDLDHTLWDFEKNSEETLLELYEHYNMWGENFNKEEFIESFRYANRLLWRKYDRNEIGREDIRSKRFAMIFDELGSTSLRKASDQISDNYLSTCPQKSHLMPEAKQILGYLHDKGYVMHILTNGFKEIQETKIKSASIEGYFDVMVASDCIGVKKPDAKVFQHALDTAGASLDTSLMVGDNPTNDIGGAMSIGLKNVLYNPMKVSHTHSPTYEISCLSELKGIL